MDLAHEEMILRLLRTREWLSGEEVAGALGVSRAMVQKEIAHMRGEGLEVQARPRLGYRLVRLPDRPLPWVVRALWPESRDWPVEFVPRVVSTMEHAHAMARSGAPEGAVVATDHQSGGRGRRGRSWETPPGTAMLASIVLRPRIAAAQAGLLPLAVAVGAARAVERVSAVRPEIKWPNDLLIGGRKVAGILVELTLAEQEVRYAVAGIGLNVHQEAFHPEVADRAASLRMAVGFRGSRAALLAAVVEEIVQASRLLGDDPEHLRALWLEGNCTIGRKVGVRTPSGDVEGLAEGIDGYGRLLVRSQGEVLALSAGDVSLSPQA